MRLPKMRLAMFYAVLLFIGLSNAHAQQSVPGAAVNASAKKIIMFDQARLKISLSMSADQTVKRTEHGTYDEISIELPEGAGELKLWTYNRRQHSAAELMLSLKRKEFAKSHIQVVTFGQLPGFAMQNIPESPANTPWVARAVIDRPGFDWLYLIAYEATTKEDLEKLTRLLQSMRAI
jgi:hypothetical protein